MCGWLKKIFGCKCSFKCCHCDEKGKEIAPEVISSNVETPANTSQESAPAVETPEVKPEDETNL